MKLRRKGALSLALAAVVAALAAGCGDRGASPADAFRAFYEAALARDTGGMKQRLSKGSLYYFEGMARSARKSTDEGLRAEAEAIVQRVPETRNEKIEGDTATLEFKNEATGVWETVEFVKEDGAWKLALDKGR
ncbi:MAG TPA: hypothetical protein VGX92_05040 [Pyrinomonadaceae bacterium]|jgi:hypothetical protein|nr:hypothetical protein [Pyrinomonadaceae bacterium]